MALNGCNAAPTTAPPTATAGWNGPDVIEVRTLGPRPMEVAELIAPDGTTWPAEQIRNEGHGETSKPRPDFGIFVEGGSSSGISPGIIIGFPVDTGRARSPPPIAGWAAIRIPDPELYRQGWPDWRIRVRLGPPAADAPTFLLPAPAPASP